MDYLEQFLWDDAGWNDLVARCRKCDDGLVPWIGEDIKAFLDRLYDHWSYCGE